MKTNTKQSLIALLTAASMAAPMAFAEGEPENVFNVTATAKDATTLELTWDSALDAEGDAVDHYRIYYGTNSVQGGDAEAYDATVDTPDSSTSYDLGSLDTGVAYYLSVTAVDTSDLESPEYSIETSAIPSDDATEVEDAVAPTVVNVIAADKTHVLVGFSEEVKLPELLAEAAFTITEQINPANILEVTAAELYADDPMNKTVVLTTAEQTKNVNYIMTASVAIVDLAGNPIESGNTDSGLFLGSDAVSDTFSGGEIVMEEETTDVPVPELTEEEEEEDVTPPEDITDLVLDFKADLEKFIITMNWTASINTAQDLVDQILYSSMDKGDTYDDGVSLGATADSHEVPNMEGGKEYTFKITTKDDSGNESVGVVKSIRLPQTGVGAGLLVLGSAAAANRALRRRRRNEDLI